MSFVPALFEVNANVSSPADTHGSDSSSAVPKSLTTAGFDHAAWSDMRCAV